MIDISFLANKLIEKNKGISNNIDNINKNNFKFLHVIGKGGFSRVWKVQSKKTKQIFALKEMSKLKIIDKKSEKSVNSEREFLSKLNHPFIVNMHYAFQDKENLYLVMDMLSGGDLRYHVSRYKKFSEEQTRFFIANVIYALQYIHSHNVIHRDIKPENLVLDENGYVRITDFGIAKENMSDNSSETSGTPGYMAPEVMNAKNHSFSVDFFAVGIIGYEFMLGKRPYYGKNRNEIKEQMLSTPAVIKGENIEHGWSVDSADFINLLLKRKAEKRLGYKKGAIELMNHSWLKYYPWTELKNKTLLAPFIPEPNDNYDSQYCQYIDKISEDTQIRYDKIIKTSYYKKAFVNFFFNGDDVKEKQRKDLEEKKRKENEEKEEKEKIEKEEKEKEKIKEILKEIENNEKILNKDKKNKGKLCKSPKDKNAKINVQKYDLKKYIHKNNNLVLKRSDRFELQESQSANFKKNRTNQNTNNFKINTNDKNIKERPCELSVNISKKFFDNNKVNIKNLKKPLFHSNSSRDIYSSNSNINKYLKKKINQFQKNINNNNNSSNNNSKMKSIKKKTKSKSIPKKKLIPANSSRGTTSANININNYYTNNIYNAIYNNIIPRQLSNKNINAKKNVNHQRASSVFSPKRLSSKIKTYRKKNSGLKNLYDKNKDSKKVKNVSKGKMNVISSSNIKHNSPTSEYIFNKIKKK